MTTAPSQSGAEYVWGPRSVFFTGGLARLGLTPYPSASSASLHMSYQ